MTQLKSHTLRACYQHGRRLSSVQDITDFSLTLLGLWRTLLAVPVGSRWLAEISDVSPEYPLVAVGDLAYLLPVF